MASRWLVTVSASVGRERLAGLVERIGCHIVEGAEPVPLDEDEQVIEVEGPAEAPARAADIDEIIKVYPSSDLTLYE